MEDDLVKQRDALRRLIEESEQSLKSRQRSCAELSRIIEQSKAQLAAAEQLIEEKVGLSEQNDPQST